MSTTFKSFQELHKHLNPHTKGPKLKPGAMLVSVTTFLDDNKLMKNGDIKLVREHPYNPSKYRTVRVPRKMMKNYVKGNADGSCTITGRKAIETIAQPFLR